MKMQWNIENMIMIVIKRSEINQMFAVNNTKGTGVKGINQSNQSNLVPAIS